MTELRGWEIYAWVALPTVMYGGYALLGLLVKGDALAPSRRTWFRAGHAHAGVLLLMFLHFVAFIARTDLPNVAKHVACGVFVVGLLAQSGGFFLHMVKGREGAASVGTIVTTVGAVLLTVAVGILVYGIATAA